MVSETGTTSTAKPLETPAPNTSQKSVIELAFTGLSDAMAKTSREVSANPESAKAIESPGAPPTEALPETEEKAPLAPIDTDVAEALAESEARISSADVSPLSASAPSAAEGREKVSTENIPFRTKLSPTPTPIPPRIDALKILLAVLVSAAVIGAGFLLAQNKLKGQAPAQAQPKTSIPSKVAEPLSQKIEKTEISSPAESLPSKVEPSQISGETSPGKADKAPIPPPAAIANPERASGKLGKKTPVLHKQAASPVETPQDKEQPAFDFSMAPQYGTAEVRQRADAQLEQIRALRQQHQQTPSSENH